MLRALIWDVDGTLAETERDGHRVAFNGAFDGALAECDDLASPAPLRSSVVPLARGPVSLRALREWLAVAAGGGCRSGYVDGARGEGRAADRSLRDDGGERSNVSAKGPTPSPAPLRAQNFRTPGIERRDSCSALQSH